MYFASLPNNHIDLKSIINGMSRYLLNKIGTSTKKLNGLLSQTNQRMLLGQHVILILFKKKKRFSLHVVFVLATNFERVMLKIKYLSHNVDMTVLTNF
jgi:hypothetical protein